MKQLLRYLLAITLTLAALHATGCNTVKGLGQDFESMGRSIQNVGD